jgi:hypothetical protein
MFRGVDPTFASVWLLMALSLPLFVLPIFNFSSQLQLLFVLEPASKYLVSAVLAGALITTSLWANQKTEVEYAIILWSFLLQLLVFRFLVRRYFKIMGIYPADISMLGPELGDKRFSPLNRRYALSLYALGMLQLVVLLKVE